MWKTRQPCAPGSPAEIETAKKKTLSLSVVEGSAWATMWGLGESFAAPFAIMLHAGNFAMSLLGTLPIILGALAQMTGASIVEKFQHRKIIITITAIIQSIGFLFLFWIPFFFPNIAAPAAIGIATLLIVINNLGAPLWISMMGDIVPEENRGRYFGMRASVTTMVMVIATFSAGRILSTCEDHHNIWLGFGILFSLAMFSRALSAIMLACHYDPPFEPSKDSYFSFWDFIKSTPRSNFARFTFAITLMNGSAAIAAPFFSVYMIRDLGWPMHKYALAQVVMQLSQYLFLRWWGIIGDRHGNRAVMAATSMLLPILPILWIISENFHYLLFIQVISGALWSGFNLASVNFVFDSVSPKKRHRAFSYNSVVNGVFVLIGGSVIGAFLAEYLPHDLTLANIQVHFPSSLPIVFIVSGLARVLICIIFFPLFKEVRNIEPITSRKILWRMAIGEPVINHAMHFLGFVIAPFRNAEKKDKTSN